MPRPRHPLTPALQQQICAFIRAGGFPPVAAEAAGVPAEVFEDWLRRGRRKGARPPYRAFAEEVAQAVAQARLAAELQALKKRPLDWLKCGPGREAPDSPGWTTAAKPLPPADREGASPLHDPEFLAFLQLLHEGLAPFPEAQAAVDPLVQSLLHSPPPPPR